MSNEHENFKIKIQGLSHEETRILSIMVDKVLEANPGLGLSTVNEFMRMINSDVAQKASDLRVAILMKAHAAEHAKYDNSGEKKP